MVTEEGILRLEFSEALRKFDDKSIGLNLTTINMYPDDLLNIKFKPNVENYIDLEENDENIP